MNHGIRRNYAKKAGGRGEMRPRVSATGNLPVSRHLKSLNCPERADGG
jgi:hypothetical protein